VLSRSAIKGQVLPVGVITALIGAPVFAVILIKAKGGR
jgi:iron complex transport system permease protein